MFTATRNGLGIAVNEMQRSINGAGLGDIPNDFEAAIDLQYTPVRQGWYYGYPSTGGGYASVQRCPNSCGRGGLADATTDSELTAVQTLAKAQKAQAIMQVISTISISIIASLAIARAIHVSRHGNGTRVFGDDGDDAAW